MIEGLACAWSTGSMGSRESSADVGVSRWTDRAGQQAAPAWSEHGLQNAPAATDKRASSWAVLHQSAGLLLTCGGPFRYLAGRVAMTARGQKAPLPTQSC